MTRIERKMLGEISCSLNVKRKQINKSDYQDSGDYPIIDQSSLPIAGYTDDASKVISDCLPVVVFGDHTRHTKYIGQPFAVGADGTQLLKPRDSELDDLFFFYLVLDSALKIGNYGYDRHFKHLREHVVSYPSDKGEQTAIAGILATVDQAIAQTEALIAKQRRIKAGLLHDLLTRGIDEQGNLRDPATHRFKESAVGLVPEEWEVKSVISEFEMATGFTLGQHRRPRHNKRRYLRVANVQREALVLDDIAELEAQDDEMIGRILREDDLLVVEGHASPDEIGRCARVTADAVGLTFQNHLFRLRSATLVSRFALAWLNGEWVRGYWRRFCGTSSGLNTINQSMLGSLPVPVPQSQEQAAISVVLDSQDAAVSALQSQYEKLLKLKTGLMQDLLTGRVGVAGLVHSR